LSSEIEKLALSGKTSLDVEDIIECIRGNGGYGVFDLINALKVKDANSVFRIYRSLSEVQEPHSLLGALNWHYGRGTTNPKERERVFDLLNEADLMIKSTGGAFPVEYLLVRLLRL
jgi:DNA polymerase III delta subunit